MGKRILKIILGFLISAMATQTALAVTEFVSSIKESGGDYSTLTTWEAATQCDLTAATTKVIAGSLTRGAINNNTAITQTTSLATATCVHHTATQMLVTGITGTPDATNTWYPTADGNDTTNAWTPTTAGDSVIAVAQIDGTWASADTTAIALTAWVTSATNYIRIYTTTAARHIGKWTTTAYRLEVTAGANGAYAIDIKENYVRLEGLQILLTNSGGWTGCKAINIDSQVTASDIRVNNNIIRGAISAANSEGIGIYGNNAAITAKLYNNVIYDFINGTVANNMGISTATGESYYLYNNTLQGSYVGVNVAAGTVIAKNNIFSGCTTAASGTFAAGTNYNATNNAGMGYTVTGGGNINDKVSQTFAFVADATDDFHLASTDTAAKDAGTDLSADANLAFSSDVDSGGRSSTWDIGADEFLTSIASGNWSATATWSGGAVPTASEQVNIANGHTVTFDQNQASAGCSGINILAGGTLNFDTATAASRTLIVKGDIVVNGTLTMRANSSTTYSTTIKFDCATDAQFGLIVESTGKLDVLGTSQTDQDCIITALTQNGNQDGYIYLKDGSETIIKYAEISWMGNNANPTRGIYLEDVDGDVNGEGFFIEGSSIHNGAQGIFMRYGSDNNVILNNSIYSHYYGIDFLDSGKNIAAFNKIYSNVIGIYFDGADSTSNTIYANVIYGNTSDGIGLNAGNSNYFYNNTIDNNSDDGIWVNSNSCVFKNNIITNHSSGGSIGISDSGTGTIIDYNLFYNNTSNGTTTAGGGTVAITTENPNFVSTDPANADFMYLDSDETTSAGPLGAGVELWGATPTAPGYINVGARLDYVKNITDDEEFNWLQDAHDNAVNDPAGTTDSLSSGDTVTTYAKNYFTDTISGGITQLANYYVKFNITSTTNIDLANEYEGTYCYFTSGLNKGKYYLIIDSTDATPDTLTLYSTDASSTFTTGDGWTVVDRVYTKDSGKDEAGGAGSGVSNLHLSKNGTAASPITWNTSGTVIVDVENTRNRGINFYYNGHYNIIDGFIIEKAKGHGILLESTTGCILQNNIIHSNGNYGIVGGKTIIKNTVFNNARGISSSGVVVRDNVVYSNSSYGIGIEVDANNIFSGNIIFNSSYGLYFYRGATDNNTLSRNFSFKNGYGMSLSGDGYGGDGYLSNNTISNNVSVANSSDGILLNSSWVTGTVIRNNILKDNTGKGVNDGGASTTLGYNLHHNNSIAGSETGAVNSDPLFYAEDSDISGVDTGSTTTILIDATQAWTENQWVGYAVKITIGATDYWAGVTSNTAERLFLAPALGATPVAGDTFIITDFHLQEDSPALGAGANLITGAANTSINIGARLGLSINDNQAGADSKYNWMQLAHDTATAGKTLDAGDTVTTYAKDYITGEIAAAITDQGPYITFETAATPTDIITASHQYEGMYCYFSDGRKKGNYYLIIDTTDGTGANNDTIAIYTDATTDFNVGDDFSVVDRVYARDGGVGQSANLYLTKVGTATAPITWNTSGTVVVDAGNARTYGLNLYGPSYNIIQGFVIKNATSYGIYSTYSNEYSAYNKIISNFCLDNGDTGIKIIRAIGTMLSGNTLRGNNYGIYLSGMSSGANALISENVFGNSNRGIDSSSGEVTILNNTVYGCDTVIYLFGADNSTVAFNKCFNNTGTYGNLRFNNGADYNIAYNNVFIHSSDGILIQDAASDNNKFRNNILAYCTDDGLDNDGTSNTHTYNNYYSNGRNYEEGSSAGTLDTGEITTAPNFYAFASGTATSGTTSTLTNSGATWTADQWRGYVVWITGAGSNLNSFRYILSNTATTLVIASTFPSAITTETYKIIDFSISAPEALGGGCSLYTGTAQTQTNIGAKLGYVSNATGAGGITEELNTIQIANDDSDTGAGDTLTIYAVEIIATGTVPATPDITDMGPYIELQVGDTDITNDDDYIGYYMYMTGGTNIGKNYLIIDSDANYDAGVVKDKVMLYTDSITGFAAGDTFKIVDRVYDEKHNTVDGNINLSTSGSAGSVITWDVNGTVVVDAASAKSYNIYAPSDLYDVKLSTSIKLINANTSTLGGKIYNTFGGYYQWGDIDPPAGLANLRVSSVTSTQATLTWTAATDARWTENGTVAHYELWYGTILADVQGRTGTASEWDDDPNDATLDNIATATTTITGLNLDTNTYYFKIWAVDDYGNEVTTEHASYFKLTSPNGAETWLVGTQQTITWKSGRTGNVGIQYSPDGGTTWKTVVASTPDDGSHTWTIPNDASTTVKIRVLWPVVELGGTGSSKVSEAVNYLSNDKILFLDVTSNFLINEYVTIASAMFGNFSAISSQDNLELDYYGQGAINAIDDKTIEIVSYTNAGYIGSIGDGWSYGESAELLL